MGVAHQRILQMRQQNKREGPKWRDPSQQEKKPGLDRVLGRRDLVLLFVVAVANLNLIPAVSASGPVTLWLWLIALSCFFWPQGAAVTELAQKWPGEGGIYLWAKRSFGEEHGFLAGWCYWLSNVVYLPTVVLSCVGVAVYVAGPKIQKLADSHAFTGIASLLIILFLLVSTCAAFRWANGSAISAAWAPSAVRPSSASWPC